jgi:energy-converting hydrogenase Eha subunit B
MAHTTLILLLLFIGGIIGWVAFAVVMSYFLISRRIELKIIKDIKDDIEHVKSEIKKLK